MAEKKKGIENSIIAEKVKISIRHLQRIWAQFKSKDTDSIQYFPKRPGMHSKDEPGRKEHSMVLNAMAKVPRGANDVYRYLKDAVKDHVIDARIPRDVIHKIMLCDGHAREEPNKKKQRTYVRYERKHSNTLWHTDYTMLSDGRWMIVYEDDSFRFITGWGIFDHATSANAIQVFKEACKQHGTPYSVLTDHGTQFYALESTKKDSRGNTEFKMYLIENNIKHIPARVGHPQTNGKIERLFREYKEKISRLTDVAGPPGTAAPIGAPDTIESDPTVRFVNYHNGHPHRSLYGLNPARAFEERALPKGESHRNDD